MPRRLHPRAEMLLRGVSRARAYVRRSAPRRQAPVVIVRRGYGRGYPHRGPHATLERRPDIQRIGSSRYMNIRPSRPLRETQFRLARRGMTRLQSMFRGRRVRNSLVGTGVRIARVRGRQAYQQAARANYIKRNRTRTRVSWDPPYNRVRGRFPFPVVASSSKAMDLHIDEEIDSLHHETPMPGAMIGGGGGGGGVSDREASLAETVPLEHQDHLRGVVHADNNDPHDAGGISSSSSSSSANKVPLTAEELAIEAAYHQAQSESRRTLQLLNEQDDTRGPADDQLSKFAKLEG